MSKAGDREFDDVIRFTRPPRLAQRVLFGLLAPLARLLGYHGSYPEYLARGPSGFAAVESLDVALADRPAARDGTVAVE